MSVPKLVRYKAREEDDDSFTVCARGECDGKINRRESIPAKINLVSGVWECRSCGAMWKNARDEAPEGPRGVRKRFYLSYILDSCDEWVEIEDKTYFAYKN